MARATRSKPAAKSSQSAESDTTKPSLPPSEQNPPKLFILPKNASQDARIVTLSNPATTAPNRYYHCPDNGIYEFVKVAAPRSTPRSLLFTSPRGQDSGSKDVHIEATKEGKDEEHPAATFPPMNDFSSGYITRSADMFVATPVDLLFFLLPILSPPAKKDQKQMFLTLDDHLDSVSGPLKHIFQAPGTRKLFESRLRAICDTVEAGDDTMFRLSIEKLASEVMAKANTVVSIGLPSSMEERFVRNALQVPVLSIKREESSISLADTQSQGVEASASQVSLKSDDAQFAQGHKRKADDEFSEPTALKRSKGTDSTPTIVLDENSQESTPSASTGESQLSLESQQSNASSMTSTSSVDSSSASQQATVAPENVIHLVRLRTALKFISSSYMPPHLRLKVDEQLKVSKTVDFTPLDDHLKYLESLREQARALRSLSDNISRKRGLDDDEAVEAREEKKRKKEEEEKRKKMVSKGVKALKKVDTSGMQKMSSFFTKLPKK